MALTLKGLSKARQADHMPFLGVYGGEGLGKTSWAAEFPNVAFARVECGPPDERELSGWDVVDLNGPVEDPRAGMMPLLDMLLNEEHDIETLAIDSGSRCDTRLITPDVCAEHGVKNLEDIPYSKGGNYVFDRWVKLLEKLDALRNIRHMTIVFICHSRGVDVTEPDMPTYRKIGLRLYQTKNISVPDLVCEVCDGVFFLRQDTNLVMENTKDKNARKLVKTGSRYFYTQAQQAYTAKNRWSMPNKILYPKGAGFEAVAKYIPALRERYGLPMPSEVTLKEEALAKQAA